MKIEGAEQTPVVLWVSGEGTRLKWQRRGLSGLWKTNKKKSVLVGVSTPVLIALVLDLQVPNLVDCSTLCLCSDGRVYLRAAM